MISVILNVYKRPETLEQQIDRIMSQSIKVKLENIHVWINKSDTPINIKRHPKINYYDSSWNTKFWGRFLVPLILTTPYIAVFDDDCFPEVNWFKNALNTMGDNEYILGGAGIFMNSKVNYANHRKIGWNGTHSERPIEVDLVGHAWFFRQQTTKYLFYEPPCMWDNGEDFMFSFLAQKYGNVKTIVPPHPETDTSIWSCNKELGLKYGNDANAYSRRRTHLIDRSKVLQHCIEGGWKLANKEL